MADIKGRVAKALRAIAPKAKIEPDDMGFDRVVDRLGLNPRASTDMHRVAEVMFNALYHSGPAHGIPSAKVFAQRREFLLAYAKCAQKMPRSGRSSRSDKAVCREMTKQGFFREHRGWPSFKTLMQGCLANNWQDLGRVADEVEEEDPDLARLLWERIEKAYTGQW